MRESDLFRLGIKVPDGARGTDLGALAAEVAEALMKIHDGRSHDEKPVREPAHADDARMADAAAAVAPKAERLHARFVRGARRPHEVRRLASGCGPERKKPGRPDRARDEAAAVRSAAFAFALHPLLECRCAGLLRMPSFHEPVSLARGRRVRRPRAFAFSPLRPRPHLPHGRLRRSDPRGIRRPCG